MSPGSRIALTTLRLRTLLVAVAMLALVLALFTQHRTAARRERRLRIELLQARSKALAEERVRNLFGDLGIVILKDAGGVELLQVGPARSGRPYTCTPTGRTLDAGFTRRLSGLLLDRGLYTHTDADDLADPQVGFRFWRGQERLDVLMSRESSSPTTPHLDVWAFVCNARGELVHGSTWWVCLEDDALAKLVNEALDSKSR